MSLFALSFHCTRSKRRANCCDGFSMNRCKTHAVTDATANAMTMQMVSGRYGDKT